jgi:hypothetical protein
LLRIAKAASRTVDDDKVRGPLCVGVRPEKIFSNPAILRAQDTLEMSARRCFAVAAAILCAPYVRGYVDLIACRRGRPATRYCVAQMGSHPTRRVRCSDRTMRKHVARSIDAGRARRGEMARKALPYLTHFAKLS